MNRKLLLTLFVLSTAIGAVILVSIPEDAEIGYDTEYDYAWDINKPLPPETADRQDVEEAQSEQAAAGAQERPLIAAIRSKHEFEVKRLLAEGADPNAPSSDEGLPPLFEAVRSGEPEIVQALLEAGADAETIYRNDKGEVHSAYSYAALYGTDYVLAALVSRGRKELGEAFISHMQHLVCAPEYCGNVLSIVALSGRERPHNALYLRPDKEKEAYLGLLRLEGTARNDADIRGRPLLPPLHAAAVKARTKTIENLLHSGADMDLRDDAGMTAADHARANDLPVIVALFEDERRARILIAAIESGDTGQVRKLLDAGADPNKGSATSLAPLAVAAIAGHEAVINELLARGAKINAEDQYYRTPIVFAAEAGNLDVMRLLLDNGAKKDGATMYKVAESGSVDGVRVLLEAGADPTGTIAPPWGQPIHVAIRNGHAEIVWMLVEAGVPLDASYPGEMSGTPDFTTLGNAITYKQTEIALQLIDRGVDTKTEFCSGESAACFSYLEMAAAKGNAVLVRKLIETGSVVNRFTRYSALRAAADNGNPEVIAILLAKGADVSVKDKDGCTALDWAIIQKRAEAAELLRKAGSVANKEGCYMYYMAGMK